MYSLLPSAALWMTASFWAALMGLSPPAPTEAPSAVAEGSLRVVFAIWAVALSTAAADILTETELASQQVQAYDKSNRRTLGWISGKPGNVLKVKAGNGACKQVKRIEIDECAFLERTD